MDDQDASQLSRCSGFEALMEEPRCGVASKAMEIDPFLRFGNTATELEELLVAHALGGRQPVFVGIGFSEPD